QEAEARYRTLVERVPAVTYIWDSSYPPGMVSAPYVSPQIESMLGFTQDDWQSDPQMWHRQVHPADRERVLAEWEASDRDGIPFGSEYRMHKKDGGIVWVRDEAVAVSRGDTGRPLFQGVMFDITERKRAEERLQEAETAETRYRTLVEQIPAVVYMSHAAVGEAGPARYISPRVEQVLGFTHEEWMADPGIWERQLHPEDHERVLAEVARTDETGDPFSLEYRMITKDGRVVWVRDEAALVESESTGPVWQGVYLDITRRKEAEAALSEAEVRYRTLVEQIPTVTYMDAVSEDDPTDASPVYISPQIEGLLGYTPDEWVADVDLWGKCVHPEDRDRVQDAGDRARLSGQPFGAEYRMIARDGRLVWVREASVLVTDDDGRPRFWQGVMSDVTDQKIGEERLREAEARYRTLVEQLPAAVYVDALNREATSVYVSPQVETLFGYTAEEWTADPQFWFDHLHPDDRERALTANARHNETGEPFDMEYRLIARDGRPVWVRDQAIVVRDEKGDPHFSQGIMLDVTERREAEELLRETEAKYRALVEHIPAVLYVDQANEDMTPVYVSPQIEQLLGVRHEEYVTETRHWSRRLHPEDRDRATEECRRGVASGEPFSTEYRMVREDGRVIWIRDEAVILHEDEGRPTLVQGVMSDITERKLAQQALEDSERREREAAERLRTLDEMKNAFLAAVSHELRSPLTSILGLALTLEQQELPAEDRTELLGRLAANARKLDRLLKDLLDIDRLNRGIVTPQYRPTDIGALVRRTVQSLEQLADRSIQVEAEPVVVPADPAKVERIVENLLANAVRHTTTETGIYVRVRPEDGGVLIAVEDDGPGVPAELRQDIFEPFRQGPTASPHAPGTGIGLSLVKLFAELHGGRAWVQDREGGGASFRVFLPAAIPAASGGHAENGGADVPEGRALSI
ncbi:MAG: PAS domain-containing protein, partial [Actinobacteria bacterium]|nr:PAS domain-containing protein [Actinomycetota bacterium]